MSLHGRAQQAVVDEEVHQRRFPLSVSLLSPRHGQDGFWVLHRETVVEVPRGDLLEEDGIARDVVVRVEEVDPEARGGGRQWAAHVVEGVHELEDVLVALEEEALVVEGGGGLGRGAVLDELAKNGMRRTWSKQGGDGDDTDVVNETE